MLYPVLIDDNSRSMFLHDGDDAVTEAADVLVGLVDDETDTACGVLGAQSVPDGDDGLGLTICFLRIAEGYEDRDGERILLSFLLDLAATLKCSAVFCAGGFMEGTDDDKEALLSSLGFYPEEELMPLYTFALSDLKIKNQKSDLGCVSLSQIREDQWENFVSETSDKDFFVTEPDDYEKDISVFLVDDKKEVQAGALLAQRGEVLFIEAVGAYGSDEEALINDLALWGADGAKKRLDPGTQVDIFMPGNRTYRDMLMQVTGNQAKKVGNLMTYTFETPVS